MNRILVIRGGAIGDFVLTLPAIKLLRDRFPNAHLAILGYVHIAALAHRRFYANAIRSIEEGALAPLFSMDSDLDGGLVEYFGSFDLIVSYLSDRDGTFENNLKRCSVKRLIIGPPKPAGAEHAAVQLARPLEQLGLHLTDPAAVLFPTNEDRELARQICRNAALVFHPGSGSETKNWPIENWERLGDHFLSVGRELIVVSGEADEDRVRHLKLAWKGKPVRFTKSLALPALAALCENATFIGHDSGISHIAAAVGARCFLLFGPSDPTVWAPANRGVTVIRAPEGELRLLGVETVIARVMDCAGKA